MKQTENTELTDRDEKSIDLSNAWLINENTLEPQPERYLAPEELKFKTDKEFNELILNNIGSLFGKNTLLIDCTKNQLECHVLIDYNTEGTPVLHLIDISFSKQNFWEVFARVSKLFTLMTGRNYIDQFVSILYGVIIENKELHDEVTTLSEVEEKNEEQSDEERKEQVLEAIEDFLKGLLDNKPFIILISDQERPELVTMRQTYPTNWGKFIIPIILQKYTDEGTAYLAMNPLYSEIEWEEAEAEEILSKPVNEKAKGKVQKSTEEDHLRGTEQMMQQVYQKIKTDLLKVNAGLEFNPKQYYISMRRGKNLAFFHIKKKSISIVVMSPEKDTRKLIKHHEVKTLTEKVQKFWNGECCTIVVNKLDKVEEVITLLKNLIK